VSYYEYESGSSKQNLGRPANIITLTMHVIYCRLLSSLIALCLIFTQTAQAYSPERLPSSHNAYNKGDLGKTLNDLGSSQNVKSLATAMLTAGVMKGLSSTDFMQGLNDGAGGPLSASSLASRLELNLTNASVNTAINSAVYGTSFTDALGNNLKNAGIDTLAAVAANGIGQSYKGDGGLLNGQPVLHDLAHAVLGCASASAKGQDCGSGALGGAVGEATAGLFGGTTDGSQLTPEQQGKVIFLTQLATAGAAIATGSNLNTALGTSQNAVVNNYLSYNEVTDLQKKIKACSGDNACVNSLMAAAVELSNSRNSMDLLNPALAQDVAAGSTLLSATTNNPTDLPPVAIPPISSKALGLRA
jgi:hypothetical protein